MCLPIPRGCPVRLTLSAVKPVLEDATTEIIAQRDEVLRLKSVADKHPFYKYNGVWTRELQNLVRPSPHPHVVGHD